MRGGGMCPWSVDAKDFLLNTFSFLKGKVKN